MSEGTYTQTGATGPEPEAEPAQHEFTGFAAEEATYAQHRPGLLERAPGQFVAVLGDVLVGPLPDYEAALSEGYRRFGLGAFLVRRVNRTEPVAQVTRGIRPCP